MSRRSYIRALVPAFVTAGAAGVAILADATPSVLAAVAIMAAAAGGIFVMEDEISPSRTSTDADPQPTSSANDTDAAVVSALLAMPIGILIVSENRTVRFANPEVSSLFGIRNVVDLPVENLRARRLLDQIDNVFRSRQSSGIEFTLSRTSDIFLRADIIPLDTGDVLVALQDETQARRAGDLHRDFVANASHELKTPLAATTGIIETLLGHARNDPEATERFLGLLARQTDRMVQLVSDLLSLNRIELNERVAPESPEDIVSIVAEMVDALSPIAEASNVQLIMDRSLPSAKVLADRDELSQVFGNLIDNAIKYGGSQSQVHVRLAAPQPDRDGMIGIEIVDQGPGIAREHIPRLTERFYRVNVRTSREKGGTGLGLAIVKHVLNRHRGQLQIESELGAGSTFRVWLPLLKGLSQNMLQAPPDAERIGRRTGFSA